MVFLIAAALSLAGCSPEEAEFVEGSVFWSFETGGPVQSSPLVFEENVYVSSDDGYLYALGARSGKERWRFPTGGGSSSPAAFGGAIFVGSADGWVYRIGDDSGQEEWKTYLGGGVTGGVAVSFGTVFVGSLDRSVYALDAETGETLWTYVTSNEVHATPTVAGQTVYIGSWDGNLYALNTADGAEQWRFRAGDYVSSTAAVADGAVFVGGEYEVPTEDDGIFHALKTNGRQQWAFWTGEGLHVGGGAAVDGGVAYFGTQDWYTDGRSDYLHAVSTGTGQELWAFATTDSILCTPAVADGQVFFQDETGFFYSVDELSGEERWRFETGGGRSSPVAYDGSVYVGGSDGKVWALRGPR